METVTITRRPTLLPVGGRLRTLLGVAALAVAIVGVVLWVDRPADDGVTSVNLTGDIAAAAPEVGAPAPDFRITTTDGKVVSLSDYKGQPVWLVFGASWCADCRAEAADLQATYQTFKDKGLQVLQVSIEEDTQAVKDYAGRVGLTFPMAADPQTIVAGQYRILGIPTHYFIDRDGIISQMRIGGMPATDMTAAAGSIVE